jgi:2-polyprenyl-3-methyl-5-hydroxy-6-metoxy-1,4-benzoquinol methylase
MGMLGARDANAVEDMDRADCDPERLDRTYRQFALVNRAISGWHGLYRSRLRPLLTPAAPATLLDIGCGGGDLALMLARMAARDGLRLDITGIDPDPRAYRFAEHRMPVQGVRFRQATSAELVAAGETFDFVISNHVLHHLTDGELQGLLTDSVKLARRLAVHNDLRRNALAYALFAAGALPMTGSYIRRDGLTSIRRSYTVTELSAVVPAGWRAERHSPFHCVLTYSPDAGRD